MDEQQELPSDSHPEAVDGFLQVLVGIVNGESVGVDITLQVGGMLVSGVLISKKQYFKKFGDNFGAAWEKLSGDHDMAEKFSWQFETLGKMDPSVDDPLYLHLDTPTFYHGTPNEVAGRGALLRVKLSAVDAFTLGTIKR